MKTAISIAVPLALLAASAFFSSAQMRTPAPPAPNSLSYEFKIVDPPNANETSVRGLNNDEVYVGDTATTAQFTAGTENGFVAKEYFFQQFSVPTSWGAKDTDANDISNCNVILGMWDTTTADHGYTLDEKGFHKLPDIPDATKQFPDWNGINAEGTIVGLDSPVGGTGNEGFILKKGVYTFYTATGARATEFNGINDKGDVVGEAFFLSNDGIGLLYRKGTFYTFQFPGSIDTVAFDINNRGEIAGAYTDSNFQDHGFILRGFPEHPKFFTVDGNNPTYPNTTIRTINDEDDIGGVLSGNGPQGTHQDLGFIAEPKEEHRK